MWSVIVDVNKHSQPKKSPEPENLSSCTNPQLEYKDVLYVWVMKELISFHEQLERQQPTQAEII